MAKAKYNTPKKVAKKSATKRVRKAVNREAANTPHITQDEWQDALRRAKQVGRDEAERDMAKELEKDPWAMYNLHKQNVKDIDQALDRLAKECTRLHADRATETARMNGYRVMVQGEM